MSTPAALNYRRFLLLSALTATVLCALSIALWDGPIAVAASSLTAESRLLVQKFMSACEILFGFGVSRYLYGVLLVTAGLVARFMKRGPLSASLLFVGLSHLTARFLADIMKPPFSRLRPFEALDPNGWHDTWFAPVGSSFPSGHAIHFWSLFFPLAVLFPRYWLAWAVLPVLVSAARVAVNDHYLSDTLASAALAALVTWAYASGLLNRGTVRAR